MGLFGDEKTKSVAGSSRVIGFLDKVDNAYMLAFDSKDIKPFVPYTDPAVYIIVLQEILSEGGRYLDTSKLRKRSQEIVLDDGRIARAVKHVDHETIDCGHGLSIPLDDRISQEQNVSVDGVRQFRTIGIRRASNDQWARCEVQGDRVPGC